MKRINTIRCYRIVDWAIPETPYTESDPLDAIRKPPHGRITLPSPDTARRLVCHVNLARTSAVRSAGAERQTELLIRELSAQSMPQRLVVLQHGALASRVDDVPNLSVRQVRGRLGALLACRGAALLHAHEPHAAQVAHAAGHKRKNYVITRRWYGPIGTSWYTRRMYNRAGVVAAVSSAVEQTVRSRFPRTPTVCVPDAWMPGQPDPQTVAHLRQKFAGKFVVGNIAAMDARTKGHETLFQAVRLLRTECPSLHVVLLGDGKLEEEYRTAANDLPQVEFAGWVDDPLSWIAAFDLFAFPSLREALGSSLLDVMRAGVPAVASRVDGIPDAVSEDAGILIPPGDPEAMARAIARLYGSETERRRLAQGARKRAEHFSPGNMARRYLQLYRTLIEKDPCTGALAP